MNDSCSLHSICQCTKRIISSKAFFSESLLFYLFCKARIRLNLLYTRLAFMLNFKLTSSIF